MNSFCSFPALPDFLALEEVCAWPRPRRVVNDFTDQFLFANVFGQIGTARISRTSSHDTCVVFLSRSSKFTMWAKRKQA